tara:strand:+ start:672 stop:1160 length:489 start_codon:yes stop_codon:yes gene_type:complete
MVAESGWNNNSDKCAPYIYLVVILICLLAGITLSSRLTGLSTTSLNKQARNFLITAGTGLLLMLGWLVIQRIAKIPDTIERKEKVLFWLSHLTLYVFIGYYAPSLFFFGICCGLIWEFFECYMFNWEKTKIHIVCKGTPDIVANLLGLGLGVVCRILRTRIS